MMAAAGHGRQDILLLDILQLLLSTPAATPASVPTWKVAVFGVVAGDGSFRACTAYTCNALVLTMIQGSFCLGLKLHTLG